jgi:hypothetical protein
MPLSCYILVNPKDGDMEPRADTVKKRKTKANKRFNKKRNDLGSKKPRR